MRNSACALTVPAGHVSSGAIPAEGRRGEDDVVRDVGPQPLHTHTHKGSHRTLEHTRPFCRGTAAVSH